MKDASDQMRLFARDPDSCCAGAAFQYLPHYLRRLCGLVSSHRASISRCCWKTSLVNSGLMRAAAPPAARRDFMRFWRRLGRKTFALGRGRTSGTVSFRLWSPLRPPETAESFQTWTSSRPSSISATSPAHNHTFHFCLLLTVTETTRVNTLVLCGRACQRRAGTFRSRVNRIVPSR